jgi:RNA polymerase sigma factor (sigma-70 family)
VDTATFEDAFEALFIEAFSVAHRILRNHEDAEDVAAETMARALDKWRRVRVSSPSGWVARVSSHLAIDIVRRRDRVRSRAMTPASGTDEGDTYIAVVELLCRLPRRQRDVLALRYLVGYSEAEIAAKLGIAPGTVKRHASRAIEHLRQTDFEELL